MIAKAKTKRKPKIDASSRSQADQTKSATSSNDILSLTSNNVDVPLELAPTFWEIMAAKKVEKKTTAYGDTWICMIKP